MSQILVRDLDPSTVSLLKQLAKKHDRSLQSEVKRILERAASKSNYDPARMAAVIRKKCNTDQKSDSVDLLRQDRER